MQATHLSPNEPEHQPSQQPQSKRDTQKNTDPLSSLILRTIPIRTQHRLSRNLTLRRQRTIIGAEARWGSSTALISPVCKLIVHHSLEHVGLVVDVAKDVFPKDVEDLVRDEEPADGHPQAVCEGGDGEGDDKVGEEYGDEDDEGFGGEEVKEEPHYPVKECGSCGLEVGEPVGNDREEDGDEEEIRQADEEVCEEEGGGAVETVGAFFGEGEVVFEEGRDVGNGHEGHEGGAKEDGVDEGLDVVLVLFETEPDSAHHDGETHVHGDADAVDEDVAVTLDPETVEESQGL